MRAELTLERWATFWPEAQLLLAAHRAEVEPGARAPFEVNLAMAEAMDAAQILVIVGARAAGALVGYCIWYISPSLDSVALAATQGPWYVLPAWRHSSIAIRLFTRSLDVLRERGVERALPHHWMGGDAAKRLGRYFMHLGAEPLEVTYSLWLN